MNTKVNSLEIKKSASPSNSRVSSFPANDKGRPGDAGAGPASKPKYWICPDCGQRNIVSIFYPYPEKCTKCGYLRRFP